MLLNLKMYLCVLMAGARIHNEFMLCHFVLCYNITLSKAEASHCFVQSVNTDH